MIVRWPLFGTVDSAPPPMGLCHITDESLQGFNDSVRYQSRLFHLCARAHLPRSDTPICSHMLARMVEGQQLGVAILQHPDSALAMMVKEEMALV